MYPLLEPIAGSYVKIALSFWLSVRSGSWMIYQCQKHALCHFSQNKAQTLLPDIQGPPTQSPPPDSSSVNFIYMCDASSHLDSSKWFHTALPFLLPEPLFILFPQLNISSSLHTIFLKCHLFYEDPPMRLELTPFSFPTLPLGMYLLPWLLWSSLANYSNPGRGLLALQSTAGWSDAQVLTLLVTGVWRAEGCRWHGGGGSLVGLSS